MSATGWCLMLGSTPLSRRRGGVRLNASVAAVVVVACALIVGAVLVVTVARSQLVQGVEAIVVARSQDLAQLAITGDLPLVLPASQSTSAQVVVGGRVVASTADIEGQSPILSDESVPASAQVLTVSSLDGGGQEGEDGDDDDGPYLVAVVPIAGDDQAMTVIVAGSLTSVEAATSALTPLLFGGVPVLVLVVGVTTWVLVGRSLRPVREMTQEASRISVTDMGRRIPVPESNDEIRLLGETLNRMLGRLENSVLIQRRFVADASHELKSPIASILTMAEVAALSPDRVDVVAMAADLGGEARRLALLVEDLLTLAQSDEQGLRLELSDFDLAKMLWEESAHLASSRVRVRLLATGPVRAVGDQRRLAQAVRNLVDNAVRHARDTIWLGVEEIDGTIRVVVADDGPGVAMVDRDRIFERFTRLDDARARDGGGSGLGLPVVRTIAEAHDGSVRVVEDDRFPGAAFQILLPARTQDR